MTLHPGNKYLENRSCPYTHTVKEGIFVAVYSGCEHWMKLLKMKKRMSCGISANIPPPSISTSQTCKVTSKLIHLQHKAVFL